MTALPMEAYSRPVEGDDPCGAALDYDVSFLELEIAARGKPGHELGGSIVAPEPPAWARVDQLVRELSAKSKDLRIAVLGVRSALHLGGVEGFRQALEGLAIYIEDFWAGLHPRPDSDDADGEIVRVNALANLCDADGLLLQLRSIPLSDSRIFGKFALRDWLAAQKAMSAPGEDPVSDIGTLENAFKDTPQDLLMTTSRELAAALVTIARIDKAVGQHVEAALASSFAALTDTLRQMQKIVDDYLPVMEASTDVEASTQAVTASPDIRDRNDVIAAIDRICRWYRLNEPSSPVPALLERVKRVVAKDFISLLTELAPSGAAEFRLLAGLPSENTN